MKRRQVLCYEPNKVRLESIEVELTIEHPNEVIVKSLFTQVSAGTELACLQGIEGWFPIPGVPGYTSVGEVIEKGTSVEHLQVGDLVYTFGPHAEFFKLDITDRWHGMCVKLPAGIRPDLASFTHMAGIAMTSIRVSEIELGDYVGVLGLGPIGNFAAQLAGLQGATVIGMDVSEKRLSIASKCGIKHLINSSQESYKEKIQEITQGKGFTTLIEASGMAAVAASNMDLIAQHGEIILLGSPRAPFQTNLTDFLAHSHYFHRDVKIKGSLEFIYPTFPIEFTKHSMERNSAIILNLINEGRLIIEPFYTHKAKPEQASEIYEGLRNSKDEYIGVVFDWT